MEYTAAYNEIVSLLQDNANPTQAVDMSAYMRDQFQFFGIKSPLRKELVREIKAMVKPMTSIDYQEFIELLWNDPHRECQYIATDLMGTIKKKLGVDWIDFLEQLIITKSWWDTVDFLAPNLLGNIDFERLTRYILLRKDSKEFFVQKAAGWALRQYSKFEPDKVRFFLDTNNDLAKLTVREGSKYL